MKNEIDELINYAIQEGFLSPEDAEEMTDEQKEVYCERCWAYEGRKK